MNENQPHVEDRKTLAQIRELALTLELRDAIEDAYHLGRIRGRLEGVESALSGVSDALGKAA